VTDEPMKESVDAVTTSSPAMNRVVPDLLVRHCQALEDLARPRRPAKARLEEALGPELARKLLSSLTPTTGRS
jgi:hypothetical protein